MSPWLLNKAEIRTHFSCIWDTHRDRVYTTISMGTSYLKDCHKDRESNWGPLVDRSVHQPKSPYWDWSQSGSIQAYWRKSKLCLGSKVRLILSKAVEGLTYLGEGAYEWNCIWWNVFSLKNVSSDLLLKHTCTQVYQLGVYSMIRCRLVKSFTRN